MKILVALILIISFSELNAQQLVNTEWVRLLVEKNSEGKGTIKQLLGDESVKYLFKEKTVLISTSDKYSTEMQYFLSDSVLTIGNFIKYKLDSISGQILICKELPGKGSSSEKLETYTFLNTDYLFDYLKQTKQLSIINDSTIIASNLFAPAYEGNIDSVFYREFVDKRSDISLAGSFIISKEGNIIDVQIPNTKKVVKPDIEKLIMLLKGTKGYWIIPPTPIPFNYKINFAFTISHFDPLVSTTVTFHPTGK